MNGKHLTGEAVLINDKLKFECRAPGRPPVIADYVPPAGDGEGIMSLELLLLSLASCFGSSVKVLVNGHLKKSVKSLRVRAEGTRRETHPTVFETVSLPVTLEVEGVDATVRLV